MAHRSDPPIRHVVVLGHPAATSFNRSVAETYCETVRACGQEAELRDLYALGFDPLLKAEERPGSRDFTPPVDVEAELAFIGDSSIVTMIYPIWFGMPPAIIKGYVDRVLGAGFLARDIKAGIPNSLLEGKRLMLLSSSASTLPWLEQQGQWLSLHHAFEIYLTTIFGMVRGEHVHFDTVVDGLDADFVNQNLEYVRERTRVVCAAMLAERHAARVRRISNPVT